MKIKLLSDSTINRIAAGEVIERPASVIKELTENAIDAGATKVDIILERAGKNLIIIADDGIGMSEEELEMAVQRHTTSKLDEKDLLNITTFGFRGEALPSIGAISKMTITSKARNSDKAYQLQLIGGENKGIRQVLHNEGTKIEVRDLFFATPARLKFLRSDKTELAASIDIVKKIALAHPVITFTLTHDGKTIFKVRGQDNTLEQSINQRVIDILGQSFAENSSLIESKHPDLSTYGFTSLPTFNRSTSLDQFLFINNRPVKDKLLGAALRVAYQDYLARDRHPVTVLFLKIDPQLVDVNVHPAKSEVRFHDPNLVRGLLISAIKDALCATSHKVSTSYSASALEFMNNNQNAPYKPLGNTTSQVQMPSYKPSDTQRQNQFHLSGKHSNYAHLAPTKQVFSNLYKPLINEAPSAHIENEAATESEANDFPLGAAKTQLYNTYIISQTDESMFIVDQHAAHERLGYEKIKKIISEKGLIKQRLLIPEIVELPDEKRAELLNEQKGSLSDLGLTIEKFGEKSIIVSETTALIGDVNIQQLIHDLGDHLLEEGENISLIKLIEHITETYACHYSIRAGRKLTVMEMNELLRQMEQTPSSGQCNHGRPTYVELKLKDIEKLFGRR